MDTQRKEGRCFNCNKQGHISRNCPNKKKDKAPVKARAADTEPEEEVVEEEDNDDEEDTTWLEGLEADEAAFVKQGRAMPTKKKLNLIRAAIRAQELNEEDF